jgi:putative DNA primase/helicase
MSGSEAVEILNRLGEGEDLEAGTEAVYLTRLETETDLDRQGDALRSLAALPFGDGVERQLRMEKARRALETNPDHPQSVAEVVKAAFKAGSHATGSESNVPGRPLSWEEVEPWPHPVTGEEIAGAFEDTLRRYVVLPDGGPVAVTLWALNTYVFDAFNVCPILALTSPEKECGKTTTRNVLAALVRRAWKCTASISPSAIFRAIDGGRDDPPTILIDEVDNLFTRREGDKETEIKTLLNSGYTRDEKAVRNVVVGNNYEPREFSTWTPKALFLIDRGGLPDTIRSRAIEVPMRRLAPVERVEEFDIGEIQAQLLSLRQKAARWAKDHRQTVGRLARSAKVPPGMRGRVADNWRPLLTVAEVLGGSWMERACGAWVSLSALKTAQRQLELCTDDNYFCAV